MGKKSPGMINVCAHVTPELFERLGELKVEYGVETYRELLALLVANAPKKSGRVVDYPTLPEYLEKELKSLKRVCEWKTNEEFVEAAVAFIRQAVSFTKEGFRVAALDTRNFGEVYFTDQFLEVIRQKYPQTSAEERDPEGKTEP